MGDSHRIAIFKNQFDWLDEHNRYYCILDKINKYKDASGRNLFAKLAIFALLMLILPYSNT